MTAPALPQPSTLWTAEVMQSVWQGSHAARSATHRAAGRWSCDVRTPPRSVLDLDTALAECTAVGCADLVQELLTRVVARLVGRAPDGEVAEPGAWLARVVDNELTEIRRSDRRRQGGPAKPGRADGVPGRVNTAIERATPDAEEREWRLTLFRLIRCWPYRGPVMSSSSWPVEQWAVEKSTSLASRTPGPEEISTDIHDVLMIATEVAGAGWVYRTILGPMSRRAGPVEHDQPGTGPDVLDRALLQLAADTFGRARQRGLDVSEAWGLAMQVIGGAAIRPQEWAVELLESYADAGAV